MPTALGATSTLTTGGAGVIGSAVVREPFACTGGFAAIRNALTSAGARQGLGWTAQRAFEAGLVAAVGWYLQHPAWCVARVGTESLRRRGMGVFVPARLEPR